MNSRIHRLLGALLGLLVLAAMPTVVCATPAAAHTGLVASSPRADQVLTGPPRAVTLTFSGAVDERTAVIQVREASGAPTAGLGVPVRVGNSGRVLSAGLPEGLTPGTRTVTWRVVSSDGHPVQGTFRFSVGIATASAAPDALDGRRDLGLYLGVARWVAFVGIALTIGTLLLVFLGWPAGLAVPTVRRILGAGLAGVGLASGASLLLYGPYLAGHGPASAIADLDLAVPTRVGILLLARLALLGVVIVLLMLWLRGGAARAPVPTRRRSGAAATLAGGGVLVLTWSLSGHGGGSDGLPALSVDVAHMLAMSAWLGGMPALLVLLIKVRDAEALARAVPVFSRTAAICLAILLATGTVQSWRQVGSVEALTSTRYGDWLLVKVGLIGVIAGLGAAARWWAVPRLLAPARAGTRRRPRLDPPVARRFGRIVALETGLGAAVLAVTAALVSTQPAAAAHESALAAATGSGPAELAAVPTEATVGFRLAPVAAGAAPAEFAPPAIAPTGPVHRRGWAQVAISPAMGGLPNELHLSVTGDQQRPLKLAAATVQLRSAEGPQRSAHHSLTSVEEGHYFVTFTVPRPGRWMLAITLRDAADDQGVVVVPFEAGSPLG